VDTNGVNTVLAVIPTKLLMVRELSDFNIKSFETFTDVLDEYIEYVKNDMKEREISSTRLFIFGHSMGGLITSMLAARRNDIDGYVTSSPCYIIDHCFSL
jgi:alpha-beta hydrolase superfamily lysophospholipase